MDELDHALLHRLTKNARASVTELSKALQVSRGTVQNRIDKLVANQVIQRFTVELGQSSRDRQISAFTLVKLKADDDRSTKAALQRLDAVVRGLALEGHTNAGRCEGEAT
ncbi:MAG: AsnC family transcriptional regulator, partial [Pseudomonadota bacterium]